MLLISTTEPADLKSVSYLNPDERKRLASLVQIDDASDYEAVIDQLSEITQFIIDMARKYAAINVAIGIDNFWADWLEPFLREGGRLNVYFTATSTTGDTILLPNIQWIKRGAPTASAAYLQ